MRITILIVVALFSTSLYWGCKKDYNPIAGPTHNPSNVPDDEMVFVQGGAFLMGNPDGVLFADEHPQHQVTVRSFLIDKYDVTQKRWRDVVVWKQGSSTTPLNPDPSAFHGDSLPVETVSWNDIHIWLEYLNRMERRTPNPFRLPTEAEWEYAARGGIHWTDNYIYSGSNIIGDVAWYFDNSHSTTHPAGRKHPNQLGIYDMSGNVFEWCQDWFHTNYIGAPSDGSAWDVEDAHNPFRVFRGGSWNFDIDFCYVTNRSYDGPPAIGNDNVGFRCAKDVWP